MLYQIHAKQAWVNMETKQRKPLTLLVKTYTFVDDHRDEV